MQNSNLKQYWNNFVNNYSKIQGNQACFGVTLMSMLNIENAECIFEAGCGPGILIPYILVNKKIGSQYISTDISEEMISFCTKNIQQKFQNYSDLKWKAQVADIEDLKEFQADTFDVYYAGFVYHLIGNPVKAFNEAYRVLKVGGRMGFSIWGRKELANNYTILKETAIEVGYQFAQSHDQFQLGQDKNKLKQILSDIGFKNIVMWYQNSATNRFNAEQLLEGQNPSMLQFLQNDEEKFKLLLKQLDEKMKQLLSEGQPLMQDCLLVLASK